MAKPSDKVASRLLLLNVSTLCFSFVGLLAKVITMPSGHVAWGRAVFALAAVVVLILIRRQWPWKLKSPRDLSLLLLTGLFLCGNWYFYFAAIKASSVSVAVVALFTYPLITALLEPWFFREKVSWIDVIAAVFVVIGVTITAQGGGIGSGNTPLGVVLGILSALSLSLSALLSRRLIKTYPAGILMFWQFVVATAVFSLFVAFDPASLSARWTGHLFMLGAVFTVLAIVLFLEAIKTLRTASTSVVLSLQPVYTIALAWLLLGENPSTQTLAGGTLILASVVATMLYHARKKHSVPQA